MEKVIKIGNKEVRLSNNIAWTMEYRDQFGKDIVPTLMPMIMSVSEAFASVMSSADGNELGLSEIASALEGRSAEVLLPLYQIEFIDIINITWSMAKVVDDDILPPKQWVAQFDCFPVDVIIPAVYDLAVKGAMSSKNLKRLRNLGKNLKNLQPSNLTISSSQDSKED